MSIIYRFGNNFEKSRIEQYEKAEKEKAEVLIAKANIANEKYIKIYCDVSFKNKDEAKTKGGKWCIEKKKWFFKYNYKSFCEDENLHTFTFPVIEVIADSDFKINNENLKLVCRSRNMKFFRTNK